MSSQVPQAPQQHPEATNAPRAIHIPPSYSQTWQSAFITHHVLEKLLDFCGFLRQKVPRVLKVRKPFSKITVIVSLVLAVIFGTITWVGLKISLRLQSWTSLKDYLEYCHDNVDRLVGATLQDCRRAIQTGLPKPPLSNFRRAIAAVSTQEIELRSVPVISFRPADFLVHKSKRAEVITLNEDADWLDFPNGATQQGVHDWFPFHWKRDVIILLAFFVLFFLLFSVLTTIMRMMLNGLSSVLFRAMRSRSRAMIVAFVLTMALIALPLLLLSHHAISRLRVAYDKAEAAYVNYYIDHSSASEEKVQNNDETYNNISPIDIIAIVMAGISIMAVAATVWIAIRRIAYWRLRAFSSDDILFIHDRFDYVTDRSVIRSTTV